MDHATGKHRGFGFVEYEDKDDAAAAIDNMHNAELFGRVLKVNYAQPMKIKGGDKGWSHQPVGACMYMRSMHALHVARCWTLLLPFAWLWPGHRHAAVSNIPPGALRTTLPACLQIWADADTYMQELEAEQEFEALEADQKKKSAAVAKAPQPAAPTDPMQALEAQAAS